MSQSNIEEEFNSQYKREFDAYMKHIDEIENREFQEIANKYSNFYRSYNFNEEENAEYIEGTRKLAQKKYENK